MVRLDSDNITYRLSFRCRGWHGLEMRVPFESLDGKPSDLFFLVLSPKDTSGPHIQALALITRNIKNAETRIKIKSSQSAEEIEEIFQGFS